MDVDLEQLNGRMAKLAARERLKISWGVIPVWVRVPVRPFLLRLIDTIHKLSRRLDNHDSLRQWVERLEMLVENRESSSKCFD